LVICPAVVLRYSRSPADHEEVLTSRTVPLVVMKPFVAVSMSCVAIPIVPREVVSELASARATVGSPESSPLI